MLLEVILFCIFAYTLASIIVQQKIFQEFREWVTQCATGGPTTGVEGWIRQKLCQLIKCMFCTGFWAGVFIALVLGYMPIVGAGYILHGFLGAFGSYLLHLLMGFLIKKAETKGIDT